MIATTHSPTADVVPTAAANRSPETNSNLSPNPNAKSNSPANPKPTILVVDDHAVTRDPLARLLGYEGFRTVCAANGAEALAALETCRPDLVLLDLVMPKVDGLAFLEAVRRDGRLADLPVVVMTGLLNTTQLARVRALGVRDVITKAKFSVDDLMSRVRDCLGAAAGRAGAGAGSQ